MDRSADRAASPLREETTPEQRATIYQGVGLRLTFRPADDLPLASRVDGGLGAGAGTVTGCKALLRESLVVGAHQESTQLWGTLWESTLWGTKEHAMDRYTVISADCHAGAALPDYRPYLEARYHGEFDRWLAGYENPFRDLTAPDANRNWDSDVRRSALEADGIVAEVIFPNTVPPFFPTSGLVTPTPPAADYPLRLAGLRAHNRWLAEWCAELPGRRAGIGQILLNDVDEAVRDGSTG